MNEFIKNNQVTVKGTIQGGFTFSHEVYGEGFYIMNVEIKRLSQSVDVIPLMVSERLMDVTQDYTGQVVLATGQFRSHNRHDDKKSYLLLSVFVREIEFLENEENGKSNEIILEGFICKEPVYRKTPLGREIADVLLAVNRPYGKSDYIPCICWGRNARYAADFKVGEQVKITGRVQSREYIKMNGEVPETKVAYEVSVALIDVIKEDVNRQEAC